MQNKLLNKLKNAAFAFLVLSGAGACSDFLDQPVSGNFSETDFYKNEAEWQNALVAAYDQYQLTYSHIWASMYLLREIPSDDVNAGGNDGNDQPGLQAIDDFNIDPQNDKIQDGWANLWTTVFRANKCINKTSGDTPAAKQIIAEAKVIRAFAYLDLVGLWGDVPLILKDLEQSEFGTTERKPRADVLNFIAEDLAAAAADLPNKKDLTTNNKWRAHKGTAQAVRGKALLWAGDYANAAAALEEVIGSNQYSLEDDPIAPFSAKNEFGKESLFELNYTGEGTGFAWGNNPEPNIIVQLMGPRGDFYVQATGDSLSGGWGFCTPRPELYNTYDPADGRRDEFLWSEATLEANGGDWTNPSAHDYAGFIRRKYGSFTTSTTNTNPTDNYKTNWVLLRYSDVLLMAAEANAKSGDEPSALNFLNQVRQRPGTDLSAVSSSGDALFQDIVEERRRELAFEGHRFMDLTRWGLADDELSDLGFTAKNQFYPIPQLDVTNAHLKQNDGY